MAIFHPSRGGNRGGKDQFKWEDVKSDKDRENYLGHSLMAPVGRWQKGKDLVWYTKGKDDDKEARQREEIRKVKEQEAQAMAAALGHAVLARPTTSISKEEMSEALKRGVTSRDSNDIERIAGMGYKGKRSRLSSDNKDSMFEVIGQNSLKSHQTEGPLSPQEHVREDSPVKSKKSKKNKKEKKTKRRRHHSSSDSDDSAEETKSSTKHRYDYNMSTKSSKGRDYDGRESSSRYQSAVYRHDREMGRRNDRRDDSEERRHSSKRTRMPASPLRREKYVDQSRNSRHSRHRRSESESDDDDYHRTSSRKKSKHRRR